MSDPLITLPYLRTLIGLKVRHQGELCVVVEVLESPPALVLSCGTPATLHADIHGRPWEYGQVHRVVPVLSADGTGLNDALLDLDVVD